MSTRAIPPKAPIRLRCEHDGDDQSGRRCALTGDDVEVSGRAPEIVTISS